MTQQECFDYVRAHEGVLNLLEEIPDNKRNSLWYGGDIATVYVPKLHITMIVSAIGDVRAELNDAKGEKLAYVKDKNNAGVFAEEMAPFLHNDVELQTALDDDRLLLENNNWWEISCKDEKDVWHDLTWCSNSDDLFDAIVEAIDGAKDTAEWLHEPKHKTLIRSYAKQVGFKVVGRLTRQKDVHKERLYLDEDGNEYLVTNCGGVVITTKDGGIV